MSEEKDADELAAEVGQELPPLPAIPLQLEPSNGIPRRSQREPGAWCRENGVTPPPDSFASLVLAGSSLSGPAVQAAPPDAVRV
jgi:phospholipid/cholesterol/gamma-HCH transport system ATP-binding protein